MTNKKLNEFKKQMREAVANYMRTEGCSCCRDYEGHQVNAERLGQLLNVPKYPDGSGRDFSKYETKKTTMTAKEKAIIIYDSPESAQIKTVTGWVSSTGRFWGKDEHMARWEGCTHKKCECGNLTEKSWTKCESCRAKNNLENYLKLPFKEWDFETPIYDDSSDKFFWSEDDLIEYIEEYQEDNNELPSLKLYLCEPQKFFDVSPDYWADIMPEDMDELPSEIKTALHNFNTVLKNAAPASWVRSKFRTEYKSNKN